MTAVSESVLMRECSSLYASFAIESLAAFYMGIVFSYLLLLITNKGRLHAPGRAAYRLVTLKLESFFREVYNILRRWSTMNKEPLMERFAFCRRANQTICAFQIAVAFLTITRWLHIGNVNGFRYLGYAITCPPMQGELVLLIGPVVPCYRIICVVTFVVTFVMLIFGWAASVIPGDIYQGSIVDFLQGGSFEDLQVTTKFWVLMPSMSAYFLVTLILTPYLVILYKLNGGEANGLPHQYLKLVGIVFITWWAFPVWWCLSFEGMSIITDTKLNAFGFSVLNVASKGAFSFQVISMVQYHMAKNELASQGFITKRGRWSTTHLDADELVVKRPQTRKETALVTLLRPYDGGKAVVAVKETSQPIEPKDLKELVEPKEPNDLKEIGKPNELASAVSAKILPTNSWLSLEENYRCFLFGLGIFPTDWVQLSDQQKAELLSRFQYIHTLMRTHYVVILSDQADKHAKGHMNVVTSDYFSL